MFSRGDWVWKPHMEASTGCPSVTESLCTGTCSVPHVEEREAMAEWMFPVGFVQAQN